MTEEPGSSPRYSDDPDDSPELDLTERELAELDLEEQARVRGLLASVGAQPESTPTDVVARLDDVLADLVAGRSASVVSLHERSAQERRRRRWPRTLMAAAAVLAGGYSVGTVAFSGSDDAGDASVAADSAVDRPSESSESSESSEGEGRQLTGTAAPGRMTAELAEQLLPVGRVTLGSSSLAADVAAVLRRGENGTSGGTAGGFSEGCVPRALGSGDTWTTARYDGRPAVLVVGPERDGTVVATVYGCAGARLGTASIPSP